MVFKVTFKDVMAMLIETFITKKITDTTLSYQPKKKFSDVVEYIRAGKMGKSMVGRATRDTDTGYLFEYEYAGDGVRFSNGGYQVTINHIGEKIISLKVHSKTEGSSWDAKEKLNGIEKKLPDFDAGEVADVPVAPAEDYSEKTLAELVDVLDKKVKELGKNPGLATLNAVADVKNAISDKVDEKPIAERAPYSQSLTNLTMYIDALKMQMNSPLANPTQFVSTYIPQMNAAIADLAAKA